MHARMRPQSTYGHPNAALQRQLRALRLKLSDESLSLFPDFQQARGGGASVGCCHSTWRCAARQGAADAWLYECREHAGSEGVCGRVCGRRALFDSPCRAPSSQQGRVAAEINTTDELMLTELIFEGVLNDLSAEEVVALLSSLVFEVSRMARARVGSLRRVRCVSAKGGPGADAIAAALGGVRCGAAHRARTRWSAALVRPRGDPCGVCARGVSLRTRGGGAALSGGCLCASHKRTRWGGGGRRSCLSGPAGCLSATSAR